MSVALGLMKQPN